MRLHSGREYPSARAPQSGSGALRPRPPEVNFMSLRTSRESLRKAWDQQAESWDEQAGRPEEYFTLRLRYVREFITRRIPPCRNLDIGCANGLLSEWLALRRFDVYGMDISEEMLERARKSLGPLLPEAPDGQRVAWRVRYRPAVPIPLVPARG